MSKEDCLMLFKMITRYKYYLATLGWGKCIKWISLFHRSTNLFLVMCSCRATWRLCLSAFEQFWKITCNRAERLCESRRKQNLQRSELAKCGFEANILNALRMTAFLTLISTQLTCCSCWKEPWSTALLSPEVEILLVIFETTSVSVQIPVIPRFWSAYWMVSSRQYPV